MKDKAKKTYLIISLIFFIIFVVEVVFALVLSGNKDNKKELTYKNVLYLR